MSRAHALLVLVCMLCASAACGPVAAHGAIRASELKQLDTNVTGVQSDGQRYVVWVTSRDVITYDSRTGRRHRVALPVSPCIPPRISALGAGQAAIDCNPSPPFVVNLRTGATTVLGPPWQPDYGVAGIGTRWIRGASLCPDQPLALCEALLNRATRAIRFEPSQHAVLNLDAAEPSTVVRCDPVLGQFTTATYDQHNYVDPGLNGVLHLGRCGGPGVALSRDETSNATVGGGQVSWAAGGSVFAYSIATRRRYRWQLRGWPSAIAHTRDHIFAARQIQEQRDGSFTAVLFAGRIPN
jgi:hypothetical protein